MRSTQRDLSKQAEKKSNFDKQVCSHNRSYINVNLTLIVALKHNSLQANLQLESWVPTVQADYKHKKGKNNMSTFSTNTYTRNFRPKRHVRKLANKNKRTKLE